MIELGQTVNYIRYKDEHVLEGQGVVRAICLDHTKRKVIQIADGEEVFNADFKAVNAPDNFKAEYIDFVMKIKALAEEGNQKAKDVVLDYNQRIEVLQNAVLGVPVEV